MLFESAVVVKANGEMLTDVDSSGWSLVSHNISKVSSSSFMNKKHI